MRGEEVQEKERSREEEEMGTTEVHNGGRRYGIPQQQCGHLDKSLFLIFTFVRIIIPKNPRILQIP